MRTLATALLILLLTAPVYADVYDLAIPGTADAWLAGPETEANFGYGVAAGDFDGDGIDDIALGAPGVGNTIPTYRRGAVYLMLSSTGFLETEIDLDSDYAHVRVLGQNGYYTGAAVAAGDLNNDGVDDLIVGAPRAEGPGAEAVLGIVFVFYGRGDWTVTLTTDDADAVIYGEKADGQFGASLAVGDFNGDAIDDLFVAAPTFEDVGLPATGKVYGFLGGALPTLIDLRPVTSEGDVEVSGGLDNQRLGVGLTLGDFDGDGYDDLALGAPGQTLPLPGSKEGADGTAYMILGRALTETLRVDLATTVSDVRIEWPNQLSNLGYALAAGDLNDDGLVDLALSAPNTPAKSAAGEVFVLYGRDEWPAVIDLFTPDLVIHGAYDGDRIGFALAFGDTNGDCVDDLYLGAPRYYSVGRGRVYIVAGSMEFPMQYEIDLGDDNEMLHEVVGPADGDELGFALALGDFDANGVADLLVGARGLDLLDPVRLQGGGAFVLASDDANLPPEAHAGPDQQASINEKLTLDGSKSVDLEGGQLQFLWEFVDGPSDDVNLENADKAKAAMTAFQPGVYIFSLTVFDCLQASEPDEVEVTISTWPEDDDNDDDDDDDNDDNDDGDGFFDTGDDNTGVYGGGGCSG